MDIKQSVGNVLLHTSELLVLVLTGSDAACSEQCVQTVLQESTSSVIREFETLKGFFHRSHWTPPDI